jgi:hypothetical protein
MIFQERQHHHWQASNKKGEFSLVKIKLALFHLFPYVAPKKNFDPFLVQGVNLPKELFGDTTDLKDFKEPIMATLLPTYFVIYYAQEVPHRDFTSNEVYRRKD